MNSKLFYSNLSVITAAVSLVLAIAHIVFVPMKAHIWFSIMTVLLFLGICIGLYYAGKNAAKSTSKYAFNNLISVAVFGKMVVSLGFLLGYKQIAHPTNQSFVIIFLLCYVVYTVFEVRFMTQLAKG